MTTPEHVWHGRRYWVMYPVGNQHIGWNTEFIRCEVIRKTAKRIHILSPTLGKLQLDREAFERNGKVYHSKPHEYFYAVRPAVDPEKPRDTPPKVRRGGFDLNAYSVLGVAPGCSQDDIKRAYKRLAKQAHPDGGGSHDAFIKLNAAYEMLMRVQ